MILDVSFKYMAEVRKTRKRSFEWMAFMGTAPMEIPEFTDAQAPIALWWRSPHLDKVSGQVCVRHIDGQLYEPVQSTGLKIDDFLVLPGGTEFRKTGRLSKQDTPKFVGVEGLRAIASSGKVVHVGRDRDLPDVLPTMSDATGIAEVINDHREVNLVEARNVMSALCLVEGVVYHKVSCPVIKLDRGYSYSIKVGYADDRYGAPVDSTYRIDRFDAVRAKFVEGVKGLQYPSKDAFDHLKPEIVDASLLTLNEPDYVIRNASRRLVEGLSLNSSSYGRGEMTLASCGRQVISDFVVLRDELEKEGHWHGLVSPLRELATSLRDGGAMRWDQSDAALAALVRLESDGVMPAGLNMPKQDEEALDMVF